MEVPNTKKPPLTMMDHFFSRVRVEAEDVAAEELNKGSTFDYTFKCDTEVFINEEDEKVHQVRLGIKTDKKEGALFGYTVDVEVVGFFLPEENYPKKNVPGMIQMIGSTLLYSAAREFIYSVTLRGPWPPIYLPTRSFIPEDAKVNTPSKPKAKAKSKAPKK